MSNCRWNFHERTALITGASAGIGAEFAYQLHRKGCSIVAVARRRERLQQLCNELNSERPGSASYLVVDLSRSDLVIEAGTSNGCADLVSYVKNSSIDILINNAGFGTFGHFHKLCIDRELEMIAVNVTSPARLMHAAIPGMIKRGGGAVVTVSSIAALQPVPYMATYSATKAFELNHSLAIRNELSKKNVRVLTVCPGPTATEFGAVAGYPGAMRQYSRDGVRKVVANSLTALERNRSWVIPTLQAKAIALGPRLLPAAFTTFIAEKVIRRLSGLKS